jgi:GT2 family glycosyltransferase
MTKQARVHAILACHNRRGMTIRALRELRSQAAVVADLTVTLFDDGSTDGTAAAVRSEFPNVHILQGDGSAFWARSMAMAEQHVLSDSSTSDDDFILWLNDDVLLLPDALGRVLQVAVVNPGAVVVGAMRDPEAPVTTYSGVVKLGRHPLRYARVDPGTTEISVDAFNGNFVLTPVRVARMLGGIDGEYSHAWADVDYGYRCGTAGVPVILASGYAGVCPTNPPPDYSGLRAAWKHFTGIKGGGNARSLARILRRHGGRGWPAYFAITYTMWWVRALRARLARPEEARTS